MIQLLLTHWTFTRSFLPSFRIFLIQITFSIHTKLDRSFRLDLLSSHLLLCLSQKPQKETEKFRTFEKGGSKDIQDDCRLVHKKMVVQSTNTRSSNVSSTCSIVLVLLLSYRLSQNRGTNGDSEIESVDDLGIDRLR